MKFEVSVPGHELMIRTDPPSFTLILMNLSNKAMKLQTEPASVGTEPLFDRIDRCFAKVPAV